LAAFPRIIIETLQAKCQAMQEGKDLAMEKNQELIQTQNRLVGELEQAR